MTQVFNIDCMEGMANTPDKYYELAIVDPPYGVGATWKKDTGNKFYKAAATSYDNKTIPNEEYFLQLFRVSKQQIIWGANYYTPFLPARNSWIIWDKGRDADKTFMSEGEMAWTSFNKVMRIVKFIWDGAKKCEPVTMMHPHQKPVALYRWLLKNYAKAGDKILDTHLGSGSSRIAAHEAGYDFTGYELDKDYFDAQEKRFAKYLSQGVLELV